MLPNGQLRTPRHVECISAYDHYLRLNRKMGKSNQLNISSHARIHCGLLNASGLFGRVDGGIGFALKKPKWELEIRTGHSRVDAQLPSELIHALGRVLPKVCAEWSLPGLSIRVKEEIPLHSGLGAKTSFLLAIARAAAILAQQDVPALSLARVVQRGGTSGIGVHCFQFGKFVWDAGHAFPSEKNAFTPSSSSLAPPPAAIAVLPVDWFDVVHFRFAESGPHGDDERAIFELNLPTSHSETAKALFTVRSLVIPGLVAHKEHLLYAGVRKLQDIGLKRIEWEHQSNITKAFRSYWSALKIPEPLGLSSFGPTMYVLTRDRERIIRAIHGFDYEPISLTATGINNCGAEVVH